MSCPEMVSKAEKKEQKARNKALHFKDKSPCIKKGGSCDKKEACAILGQCIIEHPKIAGNALLENTLKGKMDVAAIIKILREHVPGFCDSHYPKPKKAVK